MDKPIQNVVGWVPLIFLNRDNRADRYINVFCYMVPAKDATTGHRACQLPDLDPI